MNPENGTYEEEILRSELREAREKLDTLVGDLRQVDTQLEGIDGERQQFRLLQQVCEGLDQLSDLGAEDLFWGGRDAGGNGDDHIRLVRSRLDDFEKRLEQIEGQRQSILDEIQLQEESADYIAGDVLEAERIAAQKKLEWEIEREVDDIPIRFSVMPWSAGLEDDQRFRKALAISLFVSILLALILPMIDIPLPARWEVLEEQQRLTQLIREEVPLPPVVEIQEAQPNNPEEVEPAEEQSQQLAEELVPESAPAAKPAEKPSAESKGILAFRKKFSGLAKTQEVDRLGSNARISDPANLAQGAPQRSMVTSQAPGSSGGINVAALSRDTGGTGQQMTGVAVTQASSSIGSGSGNGTDRPLSGGGPGLGRTDEEIQIVFDRHKSALYRLYNRELRQNPTLKGQMVLRITIEPDGSVSMCAVKSTDMKSPKLSKQVVSRVKTFDFGAKDGVSAVTIVYPIDFLPAS